MRIYLSGPMGAGKSTVGRRVAAQLGARFDDLDELVEARAGRSIAAVVGAEGLGRFRAREREALEAWRRDGPRGAVLALGGGTLTADTGTRRRLLEDGVVVTLTASPETLARRVVANGDWLARPLLADATDPAGVASVLAAIVAERAAAYAECHAMVDATGTPEDVAARVLNAVATHESSVVVPLGEASYRVEIGDGVRARLGAWVGDRAPVIGVTDTNVDAAWPREVPRRLGFADGFPPNRGVSVAVPAGEASKDVAHLAHLWDRALAVGAHRSSPVVAFGGGVVGDLAGLAGATLHRGVPVIQMPTSLLAMVDSSVGGKTAIDHGGAKNMVGAFHQPEAVLCDPTYLSTLPEAERVAGLAEVAKAAWIAGEDDVAFLEVQADALRAGAPDAITEAVRRSVRLKARVVSEDATESAGGRAVLNLGHTFGHAFEARPDAGLRHGEAVALGLVAAFRVATHHGTPAGEGARMTRLLERLGFGPHLDRVDAFLADPSLPRLLGLDKKRVSPGLIRFLVPGAPGEVGVASLPVARLPDLAAP